MTTYGQALALESPLKFKAAETIHYYLCYESKKETLFQDRFILTKPIIFSLPPIPALVFKAKRSSFKHRFLKLHFK